MLVLIFGLGASLLSGRARTYVGPVTPFLAMPASADNAKPAPADNVTCLKYAWTQMTPSDQATLRTAWQRAKGTPQESKVVSSLRTGLASQLPSLTSEQVVEFLDWALTN